MMAISNLMFFRLLVYLCEAGEVVQGRNGEAIQGKRELRAWQATASSGLLLPSPGSEPSCTRCMGPRARTPALLASSGPASSHTGRSHPEEWRLLKMVGDGCLQVVTLFLGGVR